MSSVLLSYVAALAVLIAGFLGIYLFLEKKLQIKIRWGMFFLGIITTVFYCAAIVLLFRVTFSVDYYYNTVFFRSMVGLVFLAILCVVRLLVVRSTFFKNHRVEQGYSFSFGFGIAPAALMGVYLLLMTLVVAGNGLFNGPCIVEEEGYLSFADNTIITIFRPVAGHVSVALVFIAYAVMMTASAHLLQKLSKGNYRFGVSVAWTFFMILLEAGAILPLPFISMYKLDHWQLAVIVGIFAAINVLLVRFIPKVKSSTTYTRQFE